MKKQQQRLLYHNWVLPFFLFVFTSPVLAQIDNQTSTSIVYSTRSPQTDPNFSEDQMPHVDLTNLYKGLKKTFLEGGIKAAVNSGGKVDMKIYLYDKTEADGKGSLIYGCYTTKDNLPDNTVKAVSFDVEVPHPFDADRKVNAKSIDIKKLIAAAPWPDHNCIFTSGRRAFSWWQTAAIISTFASMGCSLGANVGSIYPVVGQLSGCVIGGLTYGLIEGLNIGYNAYEILDKYDCALEGIPYQPVIIELTVKSAKVNGLRLPLIADASKDVDLNDPKRRNLFLFPATSIALKVYKNGATTPILEINTIQTPLPVIKATLGDELKFEITSDSPNIPYFEGLPDVWIARTAGEALYYCSPSINPGDLKPFLGFDSQVHGAAIRQYPLGWNPKEDDFVFSEKDGKYISTWTYTVSREMDDEKTTYTPVYTWPIYKYHLGGLNDIQRDNQREGLNVELLSSTNDFDFNIRNFPNKFKKDYTPNTLKFPKYIFGLDPDEILYLDRQFPQTTTPARGNEYLNFDTAKSHLFAIDGEPWKDVMEDPDKSKVPNLMVDAYRRDHNFYAKPYDGYEIQDLGMGTKIGDVIQRNTDGTLKTNAKGLIDNPNGNGTGNCKAPGLVTIGVGNSKKLQFKINAKSPISKADYKGFYSQIEGTQWPAINELAVSYSLIGLGSLSIDEISKFSLVYEYEDEFGTLMQVEKKIPSSTPLSLEDILALTMIKDKGKFTAEFNINKWGYHTITAYYRSTPISKPVPVAGKELLDIGTRFTNIFTDVSKAKMERDGSYIYLEEYSNERESQTDLIKFGKYLGRYNREFAFKTTDKVKFEIIDSDPHTFPVTPKEWYLSKRTQSKRIPEDSLTIGYKGKPYLQTFRRKINESGFIDESTKTLLKSGRNFDANFADSGTYEVESVYRKTSSVYNLIHVEDYGKEVGSGPFRLGKIEFTSDTDILSINAATIKKANLLMELGISQTDIDNGKYLLAQTRFIYSDYMFTNGPRANDEDHFNRFGKYNDFAYNIEWTITPSGSSSAQPLENMLALKNYLASDTYMKGAPNTDANNYQSWYPQNWIRHVFDKKINNTRIYPPDMKLKLDGKLDYTLTESGVEPYIDELFTSNNLPIKHEPWQVRLPWISYTDYEGSRIRTNIKVIIDREKFFDPNIGAFSGKRDDIDPNDMFNNLMTDDQKDLKKYYYDFKYGRKILFDGSAINSRRAKDYVLRAYCKDSRLPNGKTLIDSRTIRIGTSARPGNTSEDQTKIEITEIPDQDHGMMVYPNPASTQFTLQFDKPVNNAELQLINLQGQLVDYRKLNYTTDSHTVPVSGFLPSGIYIVRVTTDLGIYKKELIIKK